MIFLDTKLLLSLFSGDKMVPNNFIPVDETAVEVDIKRNVTSPSVCDVCGKTYNSRGLLYKHKLTHETINIPCEQCQKICNTKKKLRDHVKRVHGDRVSCNTCQKSFSSKNNLRLSINMPNMFQLKSA